MAGHSKWAKIKRDKGSNDAKRGAVFTKIGNQIAIAARAGVDPDMNPSLATAIEKAKAANMPLANIQRAIDRVKDKSAAQLEEVTYEGYGPEGVAIIVEAATDNKNRTYPEVRHTFSKLGGNIAEPGSVSFQFQRKGQLLVAVDTDIDTALLVALDAGAEDVMEDDGKLVVYTDPKSLHAVRKNLVDQGLNVIESDLVYVAGSGIVVTDKTAAEKIIRLIDALEDLDDVVAIHSNFEPDPNIEL